MKYYLFKPIYQERVWGGTRLASDLGRSLPEGKLIGESWEIVDRPEAQSTTVDGQSIRSLIQSNPAGIMGNSWPAERPFPILVKWLDCREKLSLQVHPPAAVAPELGGEPKTENWYIAKADPGATLIAGLRQGVSREDFEAGLKASNLEPLVHSINVAAGESMLIPSGRLHAICGGNLILEIQQNSDTTYRVYDWGRVGLDGEPRQLHIEASLRSTDFADFEPNTLKPTGGDQILAESDVFKLRKLCMKPGESLRLEAGQPRILSLVTGSIEAADGSTLGASDNALLPAEHSFHFTAKSDTELLLTENFV
ncbi:MAG: mannose-6-phosphate isomerase [Puniceicoccaceae bacterium]|nr:MAG: mannose-6-phosphate isomerase [Puniceicoccaceae bacterium]